jgi:hypothetical protein
VTGLGHVYLRHYVRGAVLFALFATALNGIFLGEVIESNKALGRTLVHVSVPAAIVIWVVGLAHAYTISYGTDRHRLRTERQKLFREGLLAYLRDELDSAALALSQAVERDVDWEDADILFHLGVVELRRAERSFLAGERRSGERARTRGLRALRTCMARDEGKKWRAEIDIETARSKNAPKPMTRVLMAVPKIETTEEVDGEDDTAELLLPKSGEGKIVELEAAPEPEGQATRRVEPIPETAEAPAPAQVPETAEVPAPTQAPAAPAPAESTPAAAPEEPSA